MFLYEVIVLVSLSFGKILSLIFSLVIDSRGRGIGNSSREQRRSKMPPRALRVCVNERSIAPFL